MSDRDLRARSRRWEGSGAEVDEAEVLATRVRVGELPARRLKLAAYVGHPAARRAMGGAAPREYANFRVWARGISRWGAEALRCGAVVLGEHALRYGLEADDPALRAQLRRLTRLPHAAVGEASQRFADMLQRRGVDTHGTTRRLDAWEVIQRAFGVAYAIQRGNTLGLEVWRERWSDAAQMARVVFGEKLREDLREGLTRWALDA